jgi:hypothetical protein
VYDRFATIKNMEVPKGVLPDSPPVTPEEGEKPVVVIPDVTPPAPPVPPAPVVTPPVVPAPGSQTPPENLYSALKEAREKIKELEGQLANPSDPPVMEAFSDEGKLLENKIKELHGQIESMQESGIVQALQSQYPVIKDLSGEFDTFRSNYPGVKIENVARLFLNEKGLLEPVRKGLEKPAGGGTPPASEGFTTEEVADLRKNNHRKYLEYLATGKIRLDDMK